MSHSDVIDVTTEPSNPPTVSGKKRKGPEREGIPEHVWLAIHQLEAQYHGAGDFSRERLYLSHAPTTFDATVLGVFTTRGAANRCAPDWTLATRIQPKGVRAETKVAMLT